MQASTRLSERSYCHRLIFANSARLAVKKDDCLFQYFGVFDIDQKQIKPFLWLIELR